MTKYIEAFSWTDTIDKFVKDIVVEKPVLNVCSGDNFFGDIQVERYHFRKDWFGINGSKIKADMRYLPFKNDSFGCVFSDPPWDLNTKEDMAFAVNEFIRVAPVVYLMCPWTWGSSKAVLEKAWVRWFPGVNQAVLITKYRRKPLGSKLQGEK